MPQERTPRVRRAPIPDTAVLVVRGDALNAEILCRDATRFYERFRVWDRYGVSAFLATNSAEVDVLCATKLRAFPTVVVFLRSDLEALGVEVVATFRTPHVTLAEAVLNDLVSHLINCPHQERVNRYHEG